MLIYLEELYINDNKLGDHAYGAEMISEGIANTKTLDLRVLEINCNNNGSSGSTAIGDALLTNVSLEELYMGESYY